MPLPPRIGTAGWSYPHWNGLVYPKAHAASYHPLEQVAQMMDVVEINSSFYSPLRPEVVRLWMKKTSSNPRFQFTAKLHQDFTHKRVLDEKAVEIFKEGLRPLLAARKLGALLMQFPWSFRLTAENREFVIRLRRAVNAAPEGTPLWRSSMWHLGAALEANGKNDEALPYYIKSYVAGPPDPARRSVIESVYKKVNGSLEGLDDKIGPGFQPAAATPSPAPTPSPE